MEREPREEKEERKEAAWKGDTDPDAVGEESGIEKGGCVAAVDFFPHLYPRPVLVAEPWFEVWCHAGVAAVTARGAAGIRGGEEGRAGGAGGGRGRGRVT